MHWWDIGYFSLLLILWSLKALLPSYKRVSAAFGQVSEFVEYFFFYLRFHMHFPLIFKIPNGHMERWRFSGDHPFSFLYIIATDLHWLQLTSEDFCLISDYSPFLLLFQHTLLSTIFFPNFFIAFCKQGLSAWIFCTSPLGYQVVDLDNLFRLYLTH